jgi:hypothetical protein
MNSSSIVHSIDIDRYESIERERNETMQLDEFKQWCKDMNIGIRVDKVNDSKHRATELMNQYQDYYPKWVQRMYS